MQTPERPSKIKRSSLRSAGTLCLFSLACLTGQAAAAAQNAIQFPQVTSYTLAKTKIELPSGLAGRLNLLVLSFERNQQNQIDSWMAVTQALQHTNFNFRAYRMPVQDRENFIYRWWDNASLRGSETDPEMWQWNVPIYVDKPQFRRELSIPNEQSIVVLLVDQAGHVLWRSSGSSTAESRAGLQAAALSH